MTINLDKYPRTKEFLKETGMTFEEGFDYLESKIKKLDEKMKPS
jgi:hypothetical protein